MHARQKIDFSRGENRCGDKIQKKATHKNFHPHFSIRLFVDCTNQSTQSWECIRMANQGASLQNYNNELVKCIEDLRERREELNRQILRDEEMKAKIQQDLAVFTKRLAETNEELAKKIQAKNEYDRTIQETESAYMKILESSQTLLQVLKRETVSLTKKK
jgi:Sjoegren syndrome nuclear autoantigen 1